ncbi:hypothetical protein M422DRAFT_71670 [Sphaerobolus stellatus SS14]|uniref:Uncharacterized protein n=1 Tax=Sphaerobolus stellatus (strain SS14) TaxID=990650 RepID=A0A0C9UPK0_SPHS4|nr:hypothetical protein M422DRAFT_71670 [Sphaerobolus stellatus SS14]
MVVDLEAQATSRTVFLVLHILGGHVGIPLLLLGIYFSRSVTRHPIFVNWCISWMIFSTAYLLIFYAGHITAPNPPFLLCVAQAAIIYATGAMVGTSTFIFFLYINAVVRKAVNQLEQLKLSTSCTVIKTQSLLIPYVSFLAVFCAELVVRARMRIGESAPLNQPGLRLHHRIEIRAHLGSGIGLSTFVVANILQIFTLTLVFRHWRSIGKHLKPTANGVNLSLIIRMSIFTLVTVIGVLVLAAFLGSFKGPIPNIVLASGPLWVVFIFGTSNDLLRVWCFWRDKAVNPPSDNLPIIDSSPV